MAWSLNKNAAAHRSVLKKKKKRLAFEYESSLKYLRTCSLYLFKSLCLRWHLTLFITDCWSARIKFVYYYIMLQHIVNSFLSLFSLCKRVIYHPLKSMCEHLISFLCNARKQANKNEEKIMSVKCWITVCYHQKSPWTFNSALRGYCTPGQFLDCFCIFLKNYNTLVTSKICFL